MTSRGGQNENSHLPSVGDRSQFIDIFSIYHAVVKDGKYLLLRGGGHAEGEDSGEAVVYSERGLAREGALLKQKLELAEASQKVLIWVAPYHPEIAKSISAAEGGQPSLLWLSPAGFHGDSQPEAPPFVVESLSGWEFFLREMRRRHQFVVEFHPRVGRHEELEGFIREGLRRGAIRIKTIEHFGKIWSYNSRRNAAQWAKVWDIKEALVKMETPPDLIVAAGPSLDEHWAKIKGARRVWCADTALAPCLAAGVMPELVFSVDSGYGSFEHFIQAARAGIDNLAIVLDPLSFPQLFELPFKEIYSYNSSNPLFQEYLQKGEGGGPVTAVDNKRGDVLGAMLGAVEAMGWAQPEVLGADGGHRSYATHVRGSAYHRRGGNFIWRLNPLETYFFALSARYS